MTNQELKALCERFLAEMENGENSDINTTYIARSCLQLLAQCDAMRDVVEASKRVSELLQSDIGDGYVDTHTAADLAEALSQLGERSPKETP